LLGLTGGVHKTEQTSQAVETFERSNIPWEAYYAAVVPNVSVSAAPTQAIDRSTARNGRDAPANAKFKEDTIKIDAAKLDAILEAADEAVHAIGQACVIAEEYEKGTVDQATVAQLLSSLTETLSRAKRHSHSLQKATLSTRMVPVGRLFQKFPKIVRDLARDLQKSVTLTIEGAETEIDRVVVDGLYEPMVHMLRNALDHGVESPSERRLSGKSDDATVRLSARQEGSVVVIEVQDDGRGMSPAKIRAKAIQKQLLNDDAQLTDEESLDLIFLPGFSTKEVATNVSGRGVGMDVVRTAVESNRGTINIASKLGAGTTFSIRVPIALSIAPVMVIRSKHALIGLPSGLITRVVDLTSRPEQTILGAKTYVDQNLPLTVRSLSGSLGYAAEREDCGLVIATENPYVLSVPAIEGLVDLVVKPFTAIASDGVSGTARSTSGEIVLILDPLYVANGCRADKKSHLRS
jgi:two-component system chemotaxis sensor kinase CheA